MENYFNYFTEIEEHFQQRRGGSLLLSTLDWALIETWKDAGVPLEAVLRGIDSAFQRYEKRPSQSRKVNSLAYCAQEVLSAAEEMKEVTVGVGNNRGNAASVPGFDSSEIAAFLRRNATKIESANLPQGSDLFFKNVMAETMNALNALADEITAGTLRRLEDLERHLTALEEKVFAILLTVTPDELIVAVREQSDRELSLYRSRMPASQIQQLHQQYLHKTLLKQYNIPRLSLFYM